jgi:hypothetical protein
LLVIVIILSARALICDVPRDAFGGDRRLWQITDVGDPQLRGVGSLPMLAGLGQSRMVAVPGELEHDHSDRGRQQPEYRSGQGVAAGTFAEDEATSDHPVGPTAGAAAPPH